MNKTTTRLLLLSIFLLTFFSSAAQNIGTINTDPPGLVCPGGTARINATLTETLPYTYEYWDGESWVCCFGGNQTPYNLSIPATGQWIEIQRKYTNGVAVYKRESVGSFYTPVIPQIAADPFPGTCNTSTGRIVVTDRSRNFNKMPRRFKLYDQNNVLRGNFLVDTSICTFVNLSAGTYRVIVETPCNSVYSEKTDIIVTTSSQNPALEIALSGHDDCLSNNVNASIVLPENIPTTGVQYRMDGGTWQTSNTFSNVTPWLSHQFSARLIGCFEASTTQFVSELSIPKVQGLERAKDTDCTPANNEIRVFVPEGSDAQIQFNHSGGWYNPGQWIGPLPDGTLHIRARSAYLPSCYRDTSITLSEHGSVSLIGADASNLTDCTLNNIGLQLRTEPAVSTGLEYFVEGKGWQSSAQFSGLSNGDKRIAIRSTGLCQVGLAADTITLSEIIAPQIESIAPQGHDDCVLGNAGFSVYLVQSVSGVKFRINGGAWQAGNLFQNLPAGNYLVEAARADGTCVSSLNYALVETGSVSITGLSKANENDCIVGNAQFQVLHTGGNQQGLKFRLNGGAWQDSAIFRNLTRMAVNVEAQIQKPSCTSSIVAWPDSIREQSNFPEIASVTITGDKNCTVGAQVAFTLKVPMTATYWLSPTKNNTTGVFTGLSSGTYTFQVYKTANGCVQTRVVTIDEKLNFTLDSLRVQGGDDCLNNNAVVTIYHPYGNNYGLQFREVSRNTAWQNSNAFPLNTYGVGQYNLEARNANGCTLWSGSIYGQERLNPEITGVVGIDGLSDCALGNVTAQVQLLNASAGSTKQYRLNGGAWNLSSTLPGFRHGSSNLVELTYNFGGIGTQQCTISKSIVIDEKAKEITGVLLDAATLNDCNLNNVKATIQVDGSTSNLRYVVTGKTEGTNNIFTNLNNGQYKAIIRDVVSTCRDTFNFSVAETPALALPTPTVQNVVCFGAATGSISISPTGGMAPYTYLWSTGATSASVTGLAAGTYNVTVSDNRGCSISQTVQVTGPAQSNLPQISFTGDTSICKGASFSVSASGGGTYSWNTGATSSTISGSPENTTTYTLTVTNGLGCSASATRIIKVNALPIPNIEGINTICAGQNTSLTATGGSTYAWQHGPTGANITVSPASTTTYKVTVTNAAGCSAIYNRTVRVNALPSVQIAGLPSRPLCGTGSVVLTAISTTATSYRWSTNETSATITSVLNASAGFGVTVKDINGCEASASASVSVIPRPVAQILGGDIPCQGNSTVLTAIGGSSYLWSNNATTSSISISKPTQNQTYSVTVSNGPGCSNVAYKTVVVPAAFTLGYSLEKDQDCTPNNTQIVPTPHHAQGAVTYLLTPLNTFDFSTSLSDLGTGQYTLSAIDGKGCMADTMVVINEAPVEITGLNISGFDDCIPGNTQLNISTKGDRLPLVYRLDGVVQSGATITLPREEKTYTIEVADAAGCVVSVPKTYPEHDVLKTELIPIVDCSQSFGGIRLTVAGWNENSVSSSGDGGQTWVSGNLIDHLSPGIYPIAIRNNSNGCILNGSAVELEGLECPSLIGFTQASITITSPEEIANLPLLVNYPQYFTQEGKVTLRLKGDGFPHFFGLNEDRENSQVPNLRAEEGVDRLLTYPAGFIGEDIAAYPLDESAGDYLFPAVYIFTLREIAGSNLKVDPERNTLRVTVRLGPPETVDEEVIAVCNPDECPIAIGENYGTGYCYSWDGPIASDQVGKPQIAVCPSSETVYTQKILDTNTFELIKLNTYRIKVGGLKLAIVSNPSNHEICIGQEATLSAYSLKDGQLINQSQDIKFQWSTGETTNPIKVKPAKNKNYSIYVTELKSGCVSKAEDYVLVRNTPNVVVHPIEPLICKQGANYISTELKIANPTNGVIYSWSTGASGDKILVNQPGEYTVTATTNAACKTEVKVLVEENTSNKALSQVGGEFYKFSADIAPQGVNSSPDFELGTGGTIENHTAFNDFTLNGISLINSLEGILGSALFSALADQKILILDKSTSCRNPDILAKAKAEIIKHAVGFILFMDTDAGNLIHILGSNFKDRYTPISGDHVAFVNARLAYLQRQGLLTNKGVALHVVLNSMVDNFTANYSDIIAGFSTAEPGIVQPELRSEDPPGCKYDLDAATNFLTPAAVIVTLEQGATPFFGYKAEIADLAQAGALTWFTSNYLSHIGRFWPAGFAGAVEDYYFIGYDNVTATPKNNWDLSISPNSFAKRQEVKLWWANTNGVDAVKVYELDYVNQKATGAPTGEGAFPKGGDVTTIKKGPRDFSIVKSDRYVRFQVETKQPPVLTVNQLTLWSIKTGKDYDRTEVLVDNSGEPDLTKGYIVNIPKDELDASKGFYQIYVKFYDNGQTPEYYYFDESQCKWNPYNEFTDEEIRNAFRLLPIPKTLQAIYDLIKAFDDAVIDGGHIFFDVAGFAYPGFDVANAVWYFAEGRTTDGIVSIIGAIPGLGDGTIVVKKILVVTSTVTYYVLKFFLKNGDEITSWVRTIKYTDDADNVIESIISFDNILEELGASNIPVEELKILLGKMTDPNFTGSEAVRILKALENDPGIITRNYDLLANSPLLRTNLEVLFKFEELIGLGQISRSKLQEALAGSFGDILNAAATKGGSHVDDILGILSQSHVDDSYMSELIRRMNDYPNLANDLRENPSWLAYYDEIVQDPGRFWEIYNEGDFGYNSALTKWGSGLLRKLGIEIAGNFEKITVGNILKQEFDQGLIAAFETQITLYVGENNVEIVVDYLVKELDGTFRIVDAKYTSKSRDAFDAFNSLTPNQQVAYPMITGNNGSLKITVGASPGKRVTLGLGKEENIGSKLRNVELYVSEANNPNQLGFKTSP